MCSRGFQDSGLLLQCVMPWTLHGLSQKKIRAANVKNGRQHGCGNSWAMAAGFLYHQWGGVLRPYLVDGKMVNGTMV